MEITLGHTYRWHATTILSSTTCDVNCIGHNFVIFGMFSDNHNDMVVH